MKRTCEVTAGAKSIRIEVEGDSADDVFSAFTAAMRDASRAARHGERLDETHRYKSATVKLTVQPGAL